MFINNINPDLINIGPFSIRFYGIVYALGFLLVAYILARNSKKIKNLDKDKAYDIVTYGMIFGLIGARIFHVIDSFYLYKNNLWNVFAIWNGGLGFQGGLAGALLAVYFYCRKYKINMLQVLDVISVPVPLILFFGRIANYINSENFGPMTNAVWCVVFEKVDNLCRHPTQFYQASAQLILFIVLFFMAKKKHKKGTLMSVFLIGYGLIRIVFDFLRIHNPNNYFLGLSHTQIVGIVMVIIGSFILFRINQSSKK